MGSICGSNNPVKSYENYLNKVKLTQLKQHWSPISLFKMKKIFEANAEIDQVSQLKCISFQKFRFIFPAFSDSYECSYKQNHIQRIYQFFNQDGTHLITWKNFTTTISIFYYSDEEILSVLMFFIFDQKLKQKLTKKQLENLIDQNLKYLNDDEFEGIEEPSTIVEKLLEKSESITIEKWINESKIYFDYEKFRKIFSIFMEEQSEKRLVENFSDCNTLFDSSKNKYVGYVLNYKWFQSWKMYVHSHYGVRIDGYSNNLTYSRTLKSIKTIKTKKTLKSMKSMKSMKTMKTFKSFKSNNSMKSFKKILDTQKLRELKYEGRSIATSTKNFDLIYSNIGEKPKQIYNNILEGEFNEILTPELVENIHYVLVSEQVWTNLKLIYGGYPEFRRSGDTKIEIYPKTFKLYCKFNQNQIDYAAEQTFEVSNDMQISNLLTKALHISVDELSQKHIFFKTITMFRWKQIHDLSYKASQLSSEIIIFMAIFSKKIYKLSAFLKDYASQAENTEKIHIGDAIKYKDQSMKYHRNGIFLGKNKQNKYIIHFKGTSYIYDLCLDEETFHENVEINKNALEEAKVKHKIQNLEFIGIPNSKGLGFINSVMLAYFSHVDIQNVLKAALQKEQPQNFIEHLSKIYQLITTKKRITNNIVIQMIRWYFPEFQNFECTLSGEFLEQFTDRICNGIQGLNGEIKQRCKQNAVSEWILETVRYTSCSECNGSKKVKNVSYGLTLDLPEDSEKYYEIIFVPFAYNLRAVEMRKYGFSLKKNATLKEYKERFQKVCDLKNVFYILAEVHANNLIKNYSNARGDAFLEQLLLREDDLIYAYQICLNIHTFVNNHYSVEKVLQFKNIVIGQMIDFFHQDRWICGKVIHIHLENYTHKFTFKVKQLFMAGPIFVYGRTELTILEINPEKTKICVFPEHSYERSEQYHVRMVQRFYNEISQEMQYCNIPMMIMLASWMRTKDLELLIYQQMRAFINQDFKFQMEGEKQIYSIQENVIHEGHGKINKQMKIKKFKEYLCDDLPYEIKLTDLEGRCAICCKLQKSKVSSDEQEYACIGCEIQQQIPISWQIKPIQLRVCIDWKSQNHFTKVIPIEHASYHIMKTNRRNNICTLQSCIDSRLNPGRLNSNDFNSEDVCDCEEPIYHSEEHIVTEPNRLIVSLNRVIQEDDNYKRINRKCVNFEIQELTFIHTVYTLTAAIAIEGSQFDAKYLLYIKYHDDWLEYDDQHVRLVKKSSLQKMCALTLFYDKLWKKNYQGGLQGQSEKSIQ